MKKKLISVLLTLAVAGTMLAGCGSSKADDTKSEADSSTEKKDITIGIRADMVNQYAAVEDKLKELGYNVQSKVFDDSVQPDVALAEGSIDCNWYQHEPYLKSYNEKNGTNLVMVEPKTFYPLFAMYSDKWDSVDELPDGATIGLCNDATNQARGLHLLESQGLITLDDSVESPTMYDVKENPHNFKFLELDAATIPRSLPDVTFAVINANYAIPAGLNPTKDSIILESADNPFVNIFVTKKTNENDPRIAKLKEIYQSADNEKFIMEHFQGTILPAWK